jgi:membrane protease YdiL (CAAX protease family)
LREWQGTWFHRQVPWDICLIFFVLGVVVPWRGRLRLRQLLARPYVGPGERISLYLSTIVFQWLAVAVAAWRAWVHGFRWAEMGLAIPSPSILVGGVLGAGGLAALQWFNLRRMGRAGDRAQSMRALAERILPQTKVELAPFLALAVTAGICEEFLYRGFAITAFARVGLPAWLVVLITSGLFGLAHLYQGRGALFGTMILGIVFGAIRVSCSSLVPVVLSHAAIDIVAGIAGPRYLLSASNRFTDVSDFKSVT